MAVSVFRFRLRSEIRTRKLVLPTDMAPKTWGDVRRHLQDVQYFGRVVGPRARACDETLTCHETELGAPIPDDALWMNMQTYVLRRIPVYTASRNASGGVTKSFRRPVPKPNLAAYERICIQARGSNES
jgi:hypothetical protein